MQYRHIRDIGRGFGSGVVPPSCPLDRHDGRCQVTEAYACRREHGSRECRAEYTVCLRHGGRWYEPDPCLAEPWDDWGDDGPASGPEPEPAEPCEICGAVGATGRYLPIAADLGDYYAVACGACAQARHMGE